jgi:hypothetical protein
VNKDLRGTYGPMALAHSDEEHPIPAELRYGTGRSLQAIQDAVFSTVEYRLRMTEREPWGIGRSTHLNVSLYSLF